MAHFVQSLESAVLLGDSESGDFLLMIAGEVSCLLRAPGDVSCRLIMGVRARDVLCLCSGLEVTVDRCVSSLDMLLLASTLVRVTLVCPRVSTPVDLL